MSAGADLCADVKAYCECVRAAGHDEPHVCSCNGSWNEDGLIVAFPDLTDEQRAEADRLSAEAFLDLVMFPITSRFGGLFFDEELPDA